MRNQRWLVLFALLACIAFLAIAINCGDDDDDDGDDDVVDDDVADDDTADDDVADDDVADDDSTEVLWDGDESVVIATPDGNVEVDLNGLPAFIWTDPEDQTDKQAVLVKTVFDEALAKDFDVADYKYNFVATDGYNILTWKLDGDYRQLPAYDDLPLGWFIPYEDDDLRVIWDESLEFPGFFSTHSMNGGTIEMVENILFDQHVNVTVDYQAKGIKATVDLFGMPAFDDEGTMAVYLHLIVLDAALEEFEPPKDIDTYRFNFISNDTDGNWNLEDDLDPGEELPLWEDYEGSQDIHHGWIKNTDTDGYRLFWHEDTAYAGHYGVKHMDDGYIEVIPATVPDPV